MSTRQYVGSERRLYSAWRAMRARCSNLNYPCYHRYGGRGIGICARWDSFAVFAADMGPHPGHGWTLDRKDNEGGYSKRNCQWATRAQQAHNRAGQLSKPVRDQIVKLHKAGVRQSVLVRQFAVSSSQISRLVRGKIWRYA